MTPKESKYSWLIKHGRDAMAPVHRLPLLRFVIAQWTNITPLRKPSRVVFIWGQIHLIPLIQASTSSFKGEASRIHPLFVNSLLGCDTSPTDHDRPEAELTGHLPWQYCPAPVSSVRFLSELWARVPTARPWLWKSQALSPTHRTSLRHPGETLFPIPELSVSPCNWQGTGWGTRTFYIFLQKNPSYLPVNAEH